jgi:hypothetical protein
MLAREISIQCCSACSYTYMRTRALNTITPTYHAGKFLSYPNSYLTRVFFYGKHYAQFSYNYMISSLRL